MGEAREAAAEEGEAGGEVEAEGEAAEGEADGRAGGYRCELPVVMRIYRMHTRGHSTLRSVISLLEIGNLLGIGQYRLQTPCYFMNNVMRERD